MTRIDANAGMLLDRIISNTKPVILEAIFAELLSAVEVSCKP